MHSSLNLLIPLLGLYSKTHLHDFKTMYAQYYKSKSYCSFSICLQERLYLSANSFMNYWQQLIDQSQKLNPSFIFLRKLRSSSVSFLNILFLSTSKFHLLVHFTLFSIGKKKSFLVWGWLKINKVGKNR